MNLIDIHVAYDSREQMPVHMFEKHASTNIHYHQAALGTFDYCVWGDWETTEGKTVRPAFAIERKSVADFIGSWFNAQHRRNELAKIKRAERWAPMPVIYVIEGGAEHVATYRYANFPSGNITSEVVMSRINQMRFSGIHVYLAGSRMMAEHAIVGMLKHRARMMGAKARRAAWAEFYEQKS